MKDEVYNFFEPVFEAPLTVIIRGETDSSVDGECNVYEKNHGDKTHQYYQIILESKTNTSLLVHELVHLVKNVFKYREIPFNESNHELIAYYIEYWFKRITQKLK